MSISNLQNGFNITQSRVSEMVNRLVHLNLFYREKDLKDHRVTIFNLTDKAKHLLQDRKDLTKNVFRKILKPLSKEEQIKLVRAFETILRLMQRIEYKRDYGCIYEFGISKNNFFNYKKI